MDRKRHNRPIVYHVRHSTGWNKLWRFISARSPCSGIHQQKLINLFTRCFNSLLALSLCSVSINFSAPSFLIMHPIIFNWKDNDTNSQKIVVTIDFICTQVFVFIKKHLYFHKDHLYFLKMFICTRDICIYKKNLYFHTSYLYL